MKGKQAVNEQRPAGEQILAGRFFAVCGQACGQAKTEKVGRRCSAEKNNKNRPSFKENGLFLAAEGELESAISVL